MSPQAPAELSGADVFRASGYVVADSAAARLNESYISRAAVGAARAHNNVVE
jgi:hypothetical protein